MMRDTGSECSACGSQERWLLHNIRHRSIQRRVCTCCVLKLHPGSLCTHCFEVYEGSLPSLHERLTCLKCSSVSHLACVGLENARQYVCPSCVNPSLLFFDVGGSNKKSKGTNGEPVLAGGQGVIDQKLAKVFLAAARIAASSMTKAAATSRIEAERRVKEAAFTRKRAKEALERVVFLMEKEKQKEKQREKERATFAPASVLVMEQNKNAKGNSAVTAPVAVQKRIQNNVKTEGEDMSGGIPMPLTNIPSRDKDRWTEVQTPNMVRGLLKNGVSLEDKDKHQGPSAPVVVRQVENSLALNENDNPSNSLNLHNHVVKKEESNGVFPVSPVAGQLQHPNNNGVEEDTGKSGRLGDSNTGSQWPQSNQDALGSTTNSGVLVTGSSNTAN
ncbi:uncharacterized protein LOC122087965 [Macadamia integrifolia]|uniref:uncharacterized protein LOC122087965 n=1 Tax=Macadamia integrifolia TaxID=60698 RepID=UPI001C4E60D4|nr:uncharacterized protein LOC122087965 [Macadamia integrifolia]XP_042513035.1 uncharacterized protein LOC122087965 [Macadamia integrifolia]